MTDKDQKIHQAGLVSVLQQIHDELDAAVFAAYGWPANLTDEQILERLVALNAERAAEEARGIVRWLRPEFQCPPGPGVIGGRDVAPADEDDSAIDSRPPARSAAGSVSTADEPAPERPGKRRRTGKATPGGRESIAESAGTSGAIVPANDSRPRDGKLPWPKTQAERTKAIQDALATLTEPATPEELAKRFLRARAASVEEILAALVSLGLAHRLRGGKYQ